MNVFDELSRVVRDAIKAGGIGQPVFVRVLASVGPGEDEADAVLLSLVSAVQSWIGAPVRRIYAAGTRGPGRSAVALQFGNGASALVGAVTPGASGTGIDLLMLGNHGGLYHEGLRGSAVPRGLPAGVEQAADAALQKAIDAAIRTGQPQVLAPEGEP